VGRPVILTDRGSWYREAVRRAGFQNHARHSFGLRCSVERFFRYLKDRTRAFYNNPKRTPSTPLVDFLELFVHWYTTWR
jgi:putative transposase